MPLFLTDLLDELTPTLDRALRQGVELDLGPLGVVRIREAGRTPVEEEDPTPSHRATPAAPDTARGGPRPERRREPERLRVPVEQKAVPLRFSSASEPPPARPPRRPTRREPVGLAQLSDVLQAAPGGAALSHLAAWFGVPPAGLRPMLERLVREGFLEELPGPAYRLGSWSSKTTQ